MEVALLGKAARVPRSVGSLLASKVANKIEEARCLIQIELGENLLRSAGIHWLCMRFTLMF